MPQCVLLTITFTEMIGLVGVEVLLSFSKIRLKLLKLKYKNKSKEYQLAVKKYNFEYENKLCKNPNLKKFYSYVNSKLKLNNSIHLLYDSDKNKTVSSDFEIATLFNTNFQKVF